MSRRMRQNIIILLITIIVLLGATELALNIFDPWGIHYFDDLASEWDHVVPDSHRVLIMESGVYHFSNWSVTELDRGTRLVPNNKNGACKVVFIGDSVTWGHGVNDQDTWVNLIAAQLPDANVIDAAFEGNNSENVRGTLLDFTDADVVVYLIIGNDAEPTNGVVRVTRASMIHKYISYILQTSSSTASTP